MRKFLWMIMLVLVTALGSTMARADTLVTNGGGFVTAIDGITLNGTLYDVTFTHTVDNTFSAFASNSSTIMGIESAIDSALGSMFVVDKASFNIAIAAADHIALSSLNLNPENGPVGWFPNPSGQLSQMDYQVDNVAFKPDANFWEDFTPAVVTTPEPGALALMLPGFGLLGLMVVMRKRKAPGLVRAT